MGGKTHTVFMSYAHPDKDLADKIASRLRDFSEVRNEQAEIKVGESWASAIEDALLKAEVVLFIVPHADSPGRNNAFFELGAARALGKRIVALVPDRRESRPQDIPTSFADLVIMDAAHRPIDEIAATLKTALQGARE